MSAVKVESFAELLVFRIPLRRRSWSSDCVVGRLPLDVSEVITNIPRVNGKLVACEGVGEDVVGLGDVADTSVVEIGDEASGVHDSVAVVLKFVKPFGERVEREDAGVVCETSEHVFKVGVGEGPVRVSDRFGDGNEDILPARHVRVL